MAVNDIYQGDVHFRFQGNDNIYSFFWQIDPEGVEDEAPIDVATHMADSVIPALQPLHSPLVQFACGVGRQIFPDFSIHETKKKDVPGTRSETANEALPGQCSLVATLFGDREDPTDSNKGRDFWTGLVEQDQSNGLWQGGPLAAYQTFYQIGLVKSFTSLAGNGFQWGHFSRKLSKAVPVVPSFFTIEWIRLNHLVRTQRRRQHEDVCRPVTNFDPTSGA